MGDEQQPLVQGGGNPQNDSSNDNESPGLNTNVATGLPSNGGGLSLNSNGLIAPPTVDETRHNTVKSQRRQLRAKVTRSINRISDMMVQGADPKRVERELEELKADVSRTSELHNELYDYTPDSEYPRLDKWEADLLDAKFMIQERVEVYLPRNPNTVNERDLRADAASHRPVTHYMNQFTGGAPIVPSSVVSNATTEHSSLSGQSIPPANVPLQQPMPEHSDTDTSPRGVQAPPVSFDAWIDDLIEFKPTQLVNSVQDLTIADVLYRLEASKDIPSVELIKFDGNALKYVEFIETFKIHVHDKQHLTDDMRMVQLKMHCKGEAERAITGLGSGGIMYATALKIIKEQFGQKSVIARAYINNIIKGQNITGNNRQGLRDMSHDIVNCIATLQRINYFADSNSSESLRQVITRLPDFLITKWKLKVTEIRDQGNVPTLEHISKFVRQQVRAMFDPDFGDLEPSKKHDARGGTHKGRQGIHATQNTPGAERRPIKCYVCNETHRVTECPTLNDSSVQERLQLVKTNHLCFACLRKNHVSRECRSKKPCSIDGCTRTHHPLLHVNPPNVSGATPITDKDGILPVVRARFRAPNGRVREGNILIDSGASATIIRKDFAKALGLQGRKEGLHLSVVGGERLDQKDSRRVKFWLSTINGSEEFIVEAHEIDKTVISVPPLNRPWLSSFRHLSDLVLTHKAGPVDLILGVQYSHLHAEEEVRQGLPFEPVGKRTKLGWFVIGPDETNTSAECAINFLERVDMTTFYDLETLGVRAPNCSCPKQAISSDDRRAMKIFESSCRKEGDRYVIALPWKKDPKLLENNYVVAEKRLHSLERSLLKNKEKGDMYCQVVNQYKENQ